MFSLSITNPNGRPILPFDWLIHSSLILARCHMFFCRFSVVEKKNSKLKFVKKENTNRLRSFSILSTVMWLFFSQLSIRDSVRSALAAVVLLQLKFSRLFTNVISCFMAFSLESSISFLTKCFKGACPCFL